MIIYTRRIKPISNSQYKKLKQNKFKKERKPIECIDTKEIVTSYTQYLRTEHWRKARLQKLLLNPLCEKCDSCADLTIHHKTYKHLGQESLTELLTLCVDCHSKLHKELRIKRKLKKRKPTKRQKYLVGNKVKMLTPYRVKLMIDKNRINHKFIPIVKLGEST
jgi:5-methylcytosine-specific restriction endonuclease McrA